MDERPETNPDEPQRERAGGHGQRRRGDRLDPVQPRQGGFEVPQRSDDDRHIAAAGDGYGKASVAAGLARHLESGRAAVARRVQRGTGEHLERVTGRRERPEQRLDDLVAAVDPCRLDVGGVAARDPGLDARRKPGVRYVGPEELRGEGAGLVEAFVDATEEVRPQERGRRDVGRDEPNADQRQHHEHQAQSEAHGQPSAGLRST